MELILASQSPRRKQILSDAQLDFKIVVRATDESYPEGMAYNLVPEYIAEQKAIAVEGELEKERELTPDTVILAADTIVVLNNKIIGKPKDVADAQNILRQLSGHTHEVVTGVCIMKGERKELFHSVTKVHFNELSEEQIDFYIHRYQPFDKAGAYAIQEWIGLVGISGIEGDLYNVIGLPINKVVVALRSFA